MASFRNLFKIYLIGCIFIFSANYSFGQQIQKTSNIWHFGSFAGLDFNSSPPVAITNGRINTQEGVASVSDADGNLLFYSDGSSIWDKSHKIMPNGTNLRGHESSTQSAIIVPLLSRPNFYYIFTVDELAGSGGLSYSVVNMNLTGNGNGSSPKGDVEADEKNILLTTPVTEKITAILKPDRKSYWVITHLWNSDAFHAYEINCNGLNTNPVVSRVGGIHSGGNDNINAVGYMKASFDGKKIALTNRRNNTIEVFDFDKETGRVSNEFIFSPNSTSLYGLEFTPNGEHLFIGGINTLERFTFASNQLTNIAIDDMSPFSGNNAIRALQLGPDMKIYVSIRNLDYISVIENAESASPLLVTEDIFLDIDNQGRSCQFGLPNLFFFDVTIPDTIQLSACSNTEVEYEGEWYTAGTETAAQIEQSDGCFSTVIVRVLESKTFESERDVQVCEGESFVINNIEIPIGAQELIILENANGCDSSILITVSAYPNNQEELTFETCAGVPIVFNDIVIPPNSSQIFNFTDSNGCDSTVTVIVNEVSIIISENVESVCEGEVVIVNGIEYPPGTSTTIEFVDQNGCTNQLFIDVSLSPEVDFELEVDSTCWNSDDGSVSVLEIAGSTSPYSYTINNQEITEDPLFENLAAGNYVFTIIDENQCRYNREFEIEEIAEFSISFEDSILPCAGDGINVEIDIFPSNTPGLNWVWEDVPAGSSYFVNQEGTYTFTVFNECQTISDSVDIQLEELTIDQLFYIPNAFSPNGDGINDGFRIFATPELSINNFEFHIYDRWGNEVFQTTDPISDWDGTFRTDISEVGVYVWWLKIDGELCRSPILVDEKGDVSIISRK